MRQFFVSALVPLLLLSAPSVARADEAPEEPAPGGLRLEEIVAEGLESSPLVQAARENIEVFEAKLMEAQWAYFPRGTMKASIGPMPAKRGDAIAGYTDFGDWGPYWRVDVEGVMPIYTFGKISALKEAGEGGVDVAEATLDLARAEVRYLAEKAWWAWQLGREMEEIVEEGRKHVDRARRRLEKLEEEDADDYDQVDMLRLRVYTADVETLYVQSRRMQSVAIHGLGLLLGREGGAGLPSEEPPLQLVDVDLDPVDVEVGKLGQRLDSAAGKQPKLRIAARGADAKRALADAKWAELYPDLFLGAYFSYAGSSVADAQDSPFAHDPWNSYSGGAAVGLRYQLDIPQRIARARQAAAEADRVVQLGRVAAAEVALEIETAWREARDLEDLLRTYKRAQRAARSWLLAKSDLYDAGFATLDEVTDALVEYFKRRLGYAKAIHDYNMAIARLSRAVGFSLTAPPEAAPGGGGPQEGTEGT